MTEADERIEPTSKGGWTDDALVDGSLSVSFEDFFEIEHGRLFGALVLVTGDRQEAEDVMQEAFLRVWERWHLVQSLASPTGYLYRTAMNAFRMRRRRAVTASRRMARRLLPSDDVEAAEARSDLDRGLATLSARQRSAIVLTALLGFSSSEAAAAMGVSPANARKLAQQGRDGLRRALGSDVRGDDHG
ncbi:MAG: RNA polymerase sigma factor [Actinomycetota bacterium]